MRQSLGSSQVTTILVAMDTVVTGFFPDIPDQPLKVVPGFFPGTT